MLPKRRADDQLRKEPAKVGRMAEKAASSPAIPTRPVSRPAIPDRPAPRTPAKPASASKYNGATGPRPSTGPAKPSPAANAAPGPARPPKKGSFAEIMARGQRAQATMGQVGKIQHKRLEKPVKKEKDDMPKPETRATPRKPGSQPTARDPKDRKDPKAPAEPKAKRNTTPDEPKKKVRKPPPSTGYAGTARPRPGAPASRTSKPAAGGVVLNPQLRRPSRAREDDEDSMDGFIIDDDDDEVPPGGPRFRYDDGYESSDMEAGMDEIDDEEAMAAAIARQDDRREEEMERRRKEEKARRKRMTGW